MQSSTAASVSAAEIARFDALAGRWWDPMGPMRPLHLMNPLRVGWIADRLGRPGQAPDGMPGLRLLDIGCGAGLAAEALALRGCAVLGLDAAAAAIAAARAHAEGQGLRLDYEVGTVEDLLAGTERFAAITALEVIEHVPDPRGFITALAGLLAPGGRLFLSTLNRTPRSFLVAKLGAEYVLRWLPRGTHDWRRFLTPGELAALLRGAGLRVADIAGMSFDPFSGSWRISHDLSVNFILAAERA